MTNPPPPGNWGPPQPGPQPPYGQGQPQYGPPGQWPAQPGWGPPPQPPKNNSLKWLLIGVAILLVIAITVGATLLFTRDDGGDPPTATGSSSAAGDIASADDTGPVGIITEDPTCDPWRPIATKLANVENQGWNDRDPSVPAGQWTPKIRQQHETVADAMRAAADQTNSLTRATPNRVMRELFEQSIAYWRAYADSIPTYTARDNHLANAAGNSSNAIVSICNAILSRTAHERGPAVGPGPTPNSVSAPTYPNTPFRFIEASNSSICPEWEAMTDSFDADTAQWRESDHSVDASQRNPIHQAVIDQAASRISRFAQEMVELSEQTDNPTWIDFAHLSSQYWQAYVESVPTYRASDNDLSVAAAFLAYIPLQACLAIQG